MPVLMPGCCLQIKKTAYAQSSQIRQIRKKMVEIMTREASSCDLKELVGKFIPEAIGTSFALIDMLVTSIITKMRVLPAAEVGHEESPPVPKWPQVNALQ